MQKYLVMKEKIELLKKYNLWGSSTFDFWIFKERIYRHNSGCCWQPACQGTWEPAAFGEKFHKTYPDGLKGAGADCEFQIKSI
jgi:hypothetical protein